MALKRKLSKTEFDALNDVLKSEYKLHGDQYILDADDATELQNAFERQKAETLAAKDRADRLQSEKDAADKARKDAEEDAARKSGDVAAIERSWQEKLDAEKNANKSAVAGYKAKLKTLLERNVAQAIAAEISTVPELILPHIEKRLQADLDGDEPTTRVLDAAGKPSALKIEEFKAELVANEKFAAIIIGSKATGGNSDGGRGGGNPAKPITQMNGADRKAAYESLGAAEFNRRVAAEREEAKRPKKA